VPTFVPYETLREQNIIAGLMKTKLWLRKNTPTWMHSLWRQVWPCLPASTPPPQPPHVTAASRRRHRPHPILTSNHPLLTIISRLLTPIPPLRSQWEAYHMSASLQRIATRLEDYHGKWHHLLLLSRNNEMPHGDMELMFRLEQASAGQRELSCHYTPHAWMRIRTGANGARRGRCGG
jgi:hypothetical protein